MTLRLRLYHHRDGARVAYREAGTGPPLALLHGPMLSWKEWEPLIEHLRDRYRVVLPDLPLHGDSEDRPRHAYTIDWFAGVMAGFANEVLGRRPLIGGHDVGAELLLHAVRTGQLHPRRLVLMPNRMHHRADPEPLERAWRAAAGAAGVPGLDRLMTHAARAVLRPGLGPRLSARGNPAAADLVRHAMADVGGNPSLARSWSKAARRWPLRADDELRGAYALFDMPVLLLWADRDRRHPLAIAEEALELLPDAQLRVLSTTGYLLAYDDPVGVARELAAFCG
ncbi:MAG TPA: alpha/beta hydrolase [Solirubrobacteraceae bacterium]|jgi:pimeloyl-ACP methyl ester carboxylesterase|nr:alpha/beta hydrolase [Solirubrobacteraceae bacterium]